MWPSDSATGYVATGGSA